MAKDAHGDPLETGWENANAILTDVEYDYTERLTTLQFSSDEMEFLQMDPEELKRQLKIKAVTKDYRGPILLTWTSNFGYSSYAWVGRDYNSDVYESPSDYNAEFYGVGPDGRPTTRPPE